jgi:hypothetical protein
VLTDIFGPKRNEITGKWRKLHNEELHHQYSSPNMSDQTKKNEMGRAHSMHDYKGRCILVGKLETKTPL